MTGQPVVGRGFILEGSRDYIRHAENTPRRGQAITPADLEALRKATGVRIVSLQPRVVVVEGDYADVRRVAEALGWTAARPAGHPVASGTRNL